MTSWVREGGPPGLLPIDIPVWPVPKSVHLAASAGAARSVPRNFSIGIPPGSPPALVAAAARYQKIIASAAYRAGAGAGSPDRETATASGSGDLASVVVLVGSMETGLTFETNYSYSLRLPAGQPAVVRAETVFGAMCVSSRIHHCLS